MRDMRKRHDASFKARVALEALKADKTVAQIASEFGVHANLIRQWRQKLLEGKPQVFCNGHKKADKEIEELQAELYRQIGQLKMAQEEVGAASAQGKRRLIETDSKVIPVYRQCELLGLARSSYYYRSDRDDQYNQVLMHLIDEQFTRTPFYGVPRMTHWLRAQGHGVNPKRVRRLMRLMGLEAVYPRPRLSKTHPEHRKYPYLLRGLEIVRPDQVWCTDASRVRAPRGD